MRMSNEKSPMPNPVTECPPAAAEAVVARYAERFAFETDCADVATALRGGVPGFVLVDVRSPNLHADGHLPGALNIPRGKMTPRRLEAWPADTLFVVYCAGPHCNGADRAALHLATLGRPVKVMIGGITGWIDEGLALARGDLSSA
jgi:rhodanese-related sulfurtransferase